MSTPASASRIGMRTGKTSTWRSSGTGGRLLMLICVFMQLRPFASFCISRRALCSARLYLHFLQEEFDSRRRFRLWCSHSRVRPHHPALSMQNAAFHTACCCLHTIPLAVPSFTPRIVATSLIYNPPFFLRYALIKREMAAADVAAGRNQKPYLPDH